MVLSIQMLNTVVENTIEKSLTDITEIMIIGDFICFSDHRSFTCPSEQAPNPESTNVCFDLLKTDFCLVVKLEKNPDMIVYFL